MNTSNPTVPVRRPLELSRLSICGGLLALCPALVGSQPLPDTLTSRPDGTEMVLVPSGPFIYGIDQAELKAILKRIGAGWADIYAKEQPRQTLTATAFYIDRFEVSNERYGAFVKGAQYARASRYARYPQLNAPRQPITGVGWKDAQAYCQWSGKRLPTEVEWEKAARGTDGRHWPWGSKPETNAFNGKEAGNLAPVPVGSFHAGDSPYHVADMAGNVWEMTSSVWPDGSMVMRGGSYLNRSGDARVTVRWAASDEVNGSNWLGFRCAIDAAKAAALFAK